MNDYNQEIKDLIITKKNILERIKEKIESIKQKYYESHIDPKWLKAFAEANKDSELKKQMDRIVCHDKEREDYEYPSDQIDFDKLKSHKGKNCENKEYKKQEIASSEELKGIYAKVKEKEIDLNTIAEADLFKIFIMLQEEVKLKEDRLEIEEKEELEIADLLKQKEELEEEIKKLENEN